MEAELHRTGQGRLRVWLRKRGISGSDVTLTAAGIGLAAACALFPWYIFFNQEKFGPPAMRFSGEFTPPSSTVTSQPQVTIPPTFATQEELEDLDLFATGTVDEPKRPAIEALAQPFPNDDPIYKVVHIANGRAMVEDESGLWVVQTGSKLPDATFVRSIELRDGKWILVNSNERIFETQ